MKDDCRPTRDLLARHLDGELDPETTAQVTAHLAACADCRRELEELRRLDQLVGRSEPPPLAEEYWDWHRQEVWRRIRSRERPHRRPAPGPRFGWLRVATYGAAAAAALLVVIFGWRLLSDEPGREPTEAVAMEPRTAEELSEALSRAPAPRRAEPDRPLTTAEAESPVALETKPAPAPETGAVPAARKEPDALAEPGKAQPPADPVPRIAGIAREEPVGETDAAPLAPEAALARYRAFADSIEREAAGIRILTDSADEAPRLTALEPLPAAPGPDSIIVVI
ncbi:MAG TPA: hypothetical protein ENN51_02395, partial [candidate division WOR-3 bacterium]|nr:hypothetical protein [candidate division WOR-3 bacterium]